MIERRRFLQGLVGAAGAYVLYGCRGTDGGAERIRPIGPGPSPIPASQLPPRARPVLRTPGVDLGLPTPFGYFLPPGYFLASYIYDSLLWTDSTGQLIPWLATALPERSADGLNYRFELRDNVRWHDGRPLTPADVAFTFEFFAANRQNILPTVIFQPENVASVRTNRQTIEFRLDKPAVTFLESVAGRVPIIPQHIWASVSELRTQDRALAVGSGPYRIEEYSGEQARYLFVANDDFFLGRPFVRRIESREFGDPVSALVAGEVDAAAMDQPSAAALRRLQSEGDLGMASGPPDFLYALYWNLEKGGPLADARFRHACALAIDRNDVVRRVAAGLGEPGNPGFLPRAHPFRVEVQQYDYDPAAARRLLDEGGYRRGPGGLRTGPDGKPLKFALQTVPTAEVSRVVVQALRRVDIDVKLVPIDMVTATGGDMSVLLYGGHQGDPDYMRLVYSSRVDGGFFRDAKAYRNPEFDDLADRQLVTHDVEERKRQVARMQQIVAADLPLLHLYYPAGVFVYRKSVLDQVHMHRQGLGGALNKQALVTGVASGGTEIRPIQ